MHGLPNLKIIKIFCKSTYFLNFCHNGVADNGSDDWKYLAHGSIPLNCSV